MSSRRWIALAGFLAASFSAAAVGGFATASSVTSWYPTLAKPAWTPPASLFGPVWTVLYLLMAVAAWRIWLTPKQPGRQGALAGFFVQLGANALWSMLFFGLHSPRLAMIDILLLWALLGWLEIRFWRLTSTAGLLWAPYLAWVTFAAALNFAICVLNP